MTLRTGGLGRDHVLLPGLALKTPTPEIRFRIVSAFTELGHDQKVYTYGIILSYIVVVMNGIDGIVTPQKWFRQLVLYLETWYDIIT